MKHFYGQKLTRSNAAESGAQCCGHEGECSSQHCLDTGTTEEVWPPLEAEEWCSMERRKALQPEPEGDSTRSRVET